MKLPRDLSGEDLAGLLARSYGYRTTRSRGSHVVLTRTAGGDRHSVTVPRHRTLRTGTLDAIVSEVARFLGLPKGDVREELFR